jgi:hypothetical protein
MTIGEETHEKLQRARDLLRHAVPSGDPAAIVDRALTVLLERTERAKFGASTRPRSGDSRRHSPAGHSDPRPARDRRPRIPPRRPICQGRSLESREPGVALPGTQRVRGEGSLWRLATEGEKESRRQRLSSGRTELTWTAQWPELRLSFALSVLANSNGSR